ncbi:MAG: UDP-glucose/GDP-mannose dehydrogenase family protein [Candidatus Aenigmarchaeota archaeon]|nr:UDP-glucose/GDP-mannose dehydrogenase family protein [Candidatus Aenigmarchaeota archaeon]
MKISIIGSGVVGKKIGFGLNDLGHEIIFYDIDPKTISEIKSKNFKATTYLKDAINNSDISFICVPTPSNKNGIDLAIIKQVSRECGEIIKDKGDYHIFVIKSTIVPGTTENVIIPLLERYSNKKADKDFGVVFSPEFFTASSKSWKEDQYRIVIGEGRDKRAGDVVENLYAPLKLPIFRRDYKTAEFIKYAANLVLMSKISIHNELFRVAEKLNIDGKDVSKIVSIDKRIGKYGSIPGKGFGGACFPKDLKAFIKFSEKIGYNPKLIKEIKKINEEIIEKYGIYGKD